jgi:hypothetical protein
MLYLGSVPVSTSFLWDLDAESGRKAGASASILVSTCRVRPRPGLWMGGLRDGEQSIQVLETSAVLETSYA